MDTNERQLISQFLDQLVQARGVTKDPDADAMIRSACAQQPDAAYLLVQKSLIQEHALKNAKTQIDQLQAELNSLRSQLQSGGAAPQSASSSFFGGASFLGGGNAAPRPAPAPAYAPQQASGYPPAAPYAQATPAQSSSPFGGFLANAATTAAGVAGGAFLFEGIHSLFGGGHHSGNGDQGGGFFSSNDGYNSQQPVENVTVNNFYDNNDAGSANYAQNDNLATNDDSDLDVDDSTT